MGMRFQLGRMVAVCPQCGRRTFKPYIDNATGEPLDAGVCGRCNREVKCRYHLTPSQWHEAGGRFKPVRGEWQIRLPPPDYVTLPPSQPPEVLRRNNLFCYLARAFGEDRVRDVFTCYHVLNATGHGDATAFFLVDAEGRARSAKLMAYGKDGHRRKDPGRCNVTWLHSLLGIKPFNLRSCFFGEHLAAAFPDRTIILVESEKTALIMACADRCDRRVYMATGGCSALHTSKDRLEEPYSRHAILRDRHVILYPDADMVDRWRAAAESLALWCRSVRVVEVLRPPWSLQGSEDIGDYIMRRYKC